MSVPADERRGRAPIPYTVYRIPVLKSRRPSARRRPPSLLLLPLRPSFSFPFAPPSPSPRTHPHLYSLKSFLISSGAARASVTGHVPLFAVRDRARVTEDVSGPDDHRRRRHRRGAAQRTRAQHRGHTHAVRVRPQFRRRRGHGECPAAAQRSSAAPYHHSASLNATAASANPPCA